jgi:hypothetical protein
MTVNDILNIPEFELVSQEEDRSVDKMFCCDLLSVAMARAPEDSCWVTVMGNRNVIAVASLADVACVVLAEGYAWDEDAISAAKGKVTLMKTSLPVYEAAVKVGSQL